jgi:hypothetical protein
MSLLSELCPRGFFESHKAYEHFLKAIGSLVTQGDVKKIEPKVRSEWDLQAEFYHDPATDEVFKLHHPEFPSRGEWVKVSKGY